MVSGTIAVDGKVIQFESWIVAATLAVRRILKLFFKNRLMDKASTMKPNVSLRANVDKNVG